VALLCFHSSRWSRPLLSGLALLGLVSAPLSAADFWADHVEPILKEHCVECHSPTRSKSRLDLSTFQNALRGGDRGAGFVPGRPEESSLYLLLKPGADPHMPPKKQLSDEQLALIRTGIEKLEAKPAAAASSESASNSSTLLATGAVAVRKPVWVPPAGMAPSAVIDGFLERGWKARKVRPAARADDATWLRRIHLDLVGRIPTEEEVARFQRLPARKRRETTVDGLLAHPEHPRHLREMFDVLWMGRPTGNAEAERRDHRWYEFLETSFRENRPWDAMVRDLILARPAKPDQRGLVQFLYERQNNPQAMAEAVAPLVFGLQIGCAQCHDHMVAREIKQAHYWGMVAAFNRSKNVDSDAGFGLAESAIGGFVSFANLKKESQQARLVFFNGRTVDEPWPVEGAKEVDAPEKYRVPPPKNKERPPAPAEPQFSRRQALAEAVTRDNPLLARAAVNRVWAMFLGRGLVHPVDLMDSQHAPSHPELLDWLAQDFERSGYDLRRLIRNLVLSQAYQLDSRPAPGKAPADEAFARAIEKPLSAEQLARSLILAAGPWKADAKSPAASVTVDPTSLQRALVRDFPNLFAPEYNATLQQALFLSNSPVLESLLQPRPGNLAERLAGLADDPTRVKTAFQTVLGRNPDRDELRASVAYLQEHPGQGGRSQFLWALLSGAEFQVNH
jgi:mono/diheme cytochrome c family protein